MSLRNWLATATPATTATHRPQISQSVATVATVAGGEESGEGYRIDYTAADLAEFDGLIERFVGGFSLKTTGEEQAKQTKLLAARRRMAPARVMAELREFRALVAEATK